MQDLGSAMALLLASVFAWAGAVKVVNPTRTGASFRELGLAFSRTLARVAPLFELATAALLVVAPRAGAGLALVSLIAFTGVVIRALAQGRRVGCGCFGAPSASDELSHVEPARNLLLALGAGAVLLTPTVARPTLAAVIAVTSLAMASWLGLALLRLRHRLGAVWATPLPGSLAPR